MDCRVLSSRQLPHQSKLFLDYLERFERVKDFYAYPPTMQAVSREARKLSYPRDRRAEVAALLRAQNVAFGAGAETISNLERLEEGAVAVVTGQQVARFSGPPYAIYKALMAVQIAEELTRSGIPAGRPVGQIPLGREAGPLVHEAAELLANQGSDLLAQYLIESYGPEETYGSAFGKLFARLFAEQGLILMDPLDQGLHKVAAPLYQHALAERDALNEKLLERGKELDRAGFAPQVKVTSRSTLLFYLGDGPRLPIIASAGKFQTGERTWPREALVRLTHAEPQNFSPNALFRSVVQDYLLPTAGYIGGPAEISYFAQSEVIYRE